MSIATYAPEGVARLDERDTSRVAAALFDGRLLGLVDDTRGIVAVGEADVMDDLAVGHELASQLPGLVDALAERAREIEAVTDALAEVADRVAAAHGALILDGVEDTHGVGLVAEDVHDARARIAEVLADLRENRDAVADLLPERPAGYVTGDLAFLSSSTARYGHAG